MKELLAELEAIRTLSDRLADEIIRLNRHLDRAEQRLRTTTRLLLPVGDEDGDD